MTNPPAFTFFVGSNESETWNIAGLTLAKCNSSDAVLDNPVLSATRAGWKTLTTVLAMGCNLTQPNTFQWEGRMFTARASVPRATSPNELPEVRGAISVEGGLVVRLDIQSPWQATIHYSYSPEKRLPDGIPSRIVYEVNGRANGVEYLIESMEVAEVINKDLFEASRFIEIDSARVDIITNGVRATIRDNSKALAKAEESRLTVADLNRRKLARYIIIACGSIGILVLVRFSNQTSRNTHKL